MRRNNQVGAVASIGCLSYTPLGYGTPQISYLLRSLAAHYGVDRSIGVFAPRWTGYSDRDDRFPDFSVRHFLPAQEHRAALRAVVPALISYLRDAGFRRIGIYGAGTHTQALLELWRCAAGPQIVTLITSEAPPNRMFCGVQVAAISELAAGALDFVVLSSQSFEAQMSERMRETHPETPFAALYDSRLSRLPEGGVTVPKILIPVEAMEFRTSSVVRWLEAFRPDLLVCTHFMYFEAILRARFSPRYLIYHAFEMPDGTDGHRLEHRHREEHRRLSSRITLALFPEHARMLRYQEIFDFAGVPAAVVYNARPLKLSDPRPADKRNGKVIMQGSLGEEANFVGYLPKRQESAPHIDVFGQLQDRNRSREILLDREAASRCGFTYRGFVNNDELGQIRRDYAFSFVSWNPTSFDALHACPNKFFESIADGVPPIAGPHPQCAEILRKYNCGILLRDWSLAAFDQGMRSARDVLYTEGYHRLVENCRRAHETELSWERQFDAIRSALPVQEMIGAGGRSPRFVLLDPTLRNEMGHHFHYAQHVLSGARSAGYRTIAGVNRMIEVWLSEADVVHPIYWYDFWGRDTSKPALDPAGDSSSENFVDRTRWLLETERLGIRDHVFVPNISDQDLVALTRFVLGGIGSAGPRWHIFIRHDLPQGSDLRCNAMRELHAGFGPDRVRFYTDTAALARQHTQATGLSMVVLPIPIAAGPKPIADRHRSNPLRVTYLGDARREKGYDLLPDLVRRCKNELQSGHLLFEIQTAGSSADPRCESATAALQELALEGGVNLYDEKLSSEDYEALLRRADVILALYSEQAYRRRSSHVVVEGICDGKIVLVTRGSAPAEVLPPDCPWLCAHLDEAVSFLRSACLGASPRDWPNYELQVELSAFHNGQTLAEILVGRRDITDGAASKGPRVRRTAMHNDSEASMS